MNPKHERLLGRGLAARLYTIRCKGGTENQRGRRPESASAAHGMKGQKESVALKSS
jgi:hypothetical protein